MAVNTNTPVQLSPDLDKAQTTAFINENFRALSDSLNPLIVSDGTNNRIMIGKLPDGTYGIIVTAPGYDVTDVIE